MNLLLSTRSLTTLLLLFTLCYFEVSAQSVLFSETFTAADGATSGVSPEGLNWNTSCPNCDPVPAGEDYFEVRGNTLRGQDTNGPATFSINNLDASGCQLITFQFDYNSSGYSGSGNLECADECPFNGPPFCSGNLEDAVSDPNCSNCWDFLAWEINTGSVNDNNVVLGLDCNASANGSAVSDPLCVQQTGANPADVDIAITMSMWATNEFMEIDNVVILCYTEAQANAAGIPIPTECQTPCPVAETETFEICTPGNTVSNEDISSAIGQFDATAISVTIHNNLAQANSGANPITTYSGSTASTVMLPVRVEYADGCIVISSLELDFLQPNVSAGNDNSTTTCSSDPVNLNALLSGADGGGNWTSSDITFANPNSVDFSAAGAGTYNFTYTVTGPGTFCNTDEAMFTVTVNDGPSLNNPSVLNVCLEQSGGFSANLIDIINQINAPGILSFYLNSNGTNPITPTTDLANITPSVIYAIDESGTCPSNIVAININYTFQPAATAPSDPLVGCDNDGDGFFSFDLTSQTTTINNNSGETVTFYLDAAGNNQIFSPAAFNSAGDFVFAIVGSGSCRSESVAIELTVVMGPTIMGNVTNAICFDGNDGAISLNVSGTGSYTYTWGDNPFLNTPNRTNLETSNYFVTVSDVNGCEANTQFFVDQPTQLMNTACTELDPASSTIAADGVARIIVSGGTAPYTVGYQNAAGMNFTVMGNGPSIDITGLAAGDYSTFTITDAENCSQAIGCDFTITAPANCFLIDSIRTNAPLCNGENNGTIQVFTTGEGGPLVVNWDDGTFANSSSITNAGAGMYSVTLTDVSVVPNCVVVENNITVLATPALAITCTAGQNSSGPGNSDGQASIEFSGGRPPYDLLVSGNSFLAFTDEPAGILNLSNLMSGNYSVTITDDNGCENMCTFVVGEDNANCFTLGDETGFDASCFGAEDATINIVVADTTGPVSITWFMGAPGSEVALPQFDNQLSIMVGPGEYSYTIVDGGQDVNCTRTRGGIFVVAPDTLFVQCGELQAASTATSADGIASFLIGGRTSNDSLFITGPVDTVLANIGSDLLDLTNIPAGTYQVFLSNGAGCVSEPCSFTITSPGCNLMVDTLVTQVTCAGAMDGAISVIVDGNTGPVTYTWNNPAFNGDSAIMNLDTGTYVVTIEQDASCLRELTINIAQPDSILLLCSSNQPTSTPLANDGIGGVAYAGGTAPYEIAINGGLISDTLRNIAEPGDTTFENLPVGVYNITVTDANGCTENCQFTIGSAGCPLSATFVVEGVSCNGEMDGRITLMISGNNGSVFVDWDDNQYDGQQDISGLEPGNYSATITDDGGCTFPIGPIAISEPTELMLVCQVNSPVSVPNAMDGSAQTTITGGTAPFQVILQRFITPTFSLNDTIVTSDNVIIRNDLSGGNSPETTYAFTVIDANGCRNTCTFTLFEPSCPPFFIQQQVIENINCRGDSTGRLEVRVVGPATAPFTFEWIPTQPDTNVLENLPAGVYTAIVTDANMCTAAQQFELVEPSRLPEISCLALTDESAPGTQNGSAQVTLAGETAFFTVTIMGPNDTTFVDVPDTTTQLLTGLQSGIYTVFATDSTGCSTDTCSFEIGQGMCALSVIADVIDQDCRGLGRVDVTVNNGLAPFTYDWSVDTLDGNEDVELAAGVYFLTVTDFAGCADTLSISVDSIAADPLLTAMADVTPADCSGNGTVDVLVSGNVLGVTYDWSVDSLDGQEDVELAAGNYQLTITETGSTCQAVLPISVGEIDNAPTISFVAGDPVCVTESASIELSFTGDGPFVVNYQVAPNAPTQVTVTALDTVIMFPTNSTSGTSLDITVFSVADANGCTQTIDQASSVAINYPDTVRVFETRCIGETINVGGIDFDANNPSDTFFVASAADCGDVFEVGFNFIEAEIDTFRTTVCAGVPTELFGTIFDGNNPEQLVAIDEPSVAGCDSFLYVIVDFFPVAQGATTFNACRGDTISEFGRIFTFEDNSGIVILEGASVNGCDSLLAVTVNFGDAPEVRLRGTAGVCQGESTDLRFEVIGGGTVDVSITDEDGNVQVINGVGDDDLFAVSPDFTTTYSILAANSASACPVNFTTNSVTVTVSRLSASLETSIDQAGFQISCNNANDGSLNLVINEGLPPYSIQWSNGATTNQINNLSAGNYTVTLTDDAGCQRSYAQFMQEPPPLVFSTLALAPDCNSDFGQVILDTVFGGVPPYEISLDGEFYEQISALPFAQTIEPGTYTIFLQDGADCNTSTEVFVPEPNEAQVVLTPDTTIFLGDSVFIFAQTNVLADTIIWSPAESVTTPNSLSTYVTPLETTVYSIYLADSLGCAITGDVQVTVDRRERIYIPNIFSPNSDGSNDLFRVFPGPGVLQVDVLQIFDRWGDLVYEVREFDPNDPAAGWDGTLNGTEMNSAVFVFYLRATMVDGRKFERKGDVVLRRR